jgi:DEAD/DEAH box helicase domain-containing protein
LLFFSKSSFGPPTMLDRLVADLEKASWYRNQIVHATTLPATQAEHAKVSVHPTLARSLERDGIVLYRHQATAITAVRQGQDVIITTPTASGKTLAFNVPILEMLIEDPNACALYIYPLKALANDQLEALIEIERRCGLNLAPSTYDGDTPAGRRGRIKRTARIVLTNAHALHQYLPWHHQWARIFANLKAIVLDEAHVYRGVFGANVAFLLQRLFRILNHYGASPRIVLSSASIANPVEFARALTGRDAVSVQDDTSARGAKTVLFWDPSLDTRSSISTQAARLMAFLTSRGVQTLCFTRTRAMAEWIARTSQRMNGKSISAYRAGYLPEQRRRLEAGLRDGTISGIVSTSALESGIDIGGLDAVLLVGFPGSLLSAWQQAGRAGRGTASSLVTYIPYENPLDRYFLRHPDRFLSNDRERLIVPSGNPRQRASHLACAAAELPLREDELDPEETAIAETLCARQLLAETPRGYVYRGLRRAHEILALDDLAGETVRLVCRGQLLETMEPNRACRDAFPGAVLLHRGETYVVERLDLDERVAEARREDVGHRTVSLRASEVQIRSVEQSYRRGDVNPSWGRVRVTETFVGYKTIDSDRTVSVAPLDLPPHTFESDALWIPLKGAIPGLANVDLLGALHGTEHALIAVTPLLVLCDAEDVGGVSTPFHPQTSGATVLLYDAVAGGAGIAEILFASFPRLAERARTLVEDCPCDKGCPACLLSPRCGSQNEPLSKPGTIQILEFLARESGPRGDS